MIEIEAKLRVDSLEPISQKLPQIGAKEIGTVFQRDFYFDDKSGSMKNSDKALRLRIEERDGNKKNILAFKGPRENGRFKRRQEIEFAVANPEPAIDLLDALGFKKVLTIEKTRRLWRVQECEVGLDDLPELGSFVEIEGPSEEKIVEVQDMLGLSNVPHIKESYASLIQQKNET